MQISFWSALVYSVYVFDFITQIRVFGNTVSIYTADQSAACVLCMQPLPFLLMPNWWYVSGWCSLSAFQLAITGESCRYDIWHKMEYVDTSVTQWQLSVKEVQCRPITTTPDRTLPTAARRLENLTRWVTPSPSPSMAWHITATQSQTVSTAVSVAHLVPMKWHLVQRMKTSPRLLLIPMNRRYWRNCSMLIGLWFICLLFSSKVFNSLQLK